MAYQYEVVVIGSGSAGNEACLAQQRLEPCGNGLTILEFGVDASVNYAIVERLTAALNRGGGQRIALKTDPQSCLSSERFLSVLARVSA